MPFIPKDYKSITLGLCIQGYNYLYKVESEEIENKDLRQKIEFIIDELIKLRGIGFAGACWGYDFDWEARYAPIPAYQPISVDNFL